MANLSTLSLAALVALHNTAIVDYAPEGFGEVAKFKSKAQGVAAIDALCAAGNLAIAFDGDNATIVDAMEAPKSEGGEGGEAPELNANEGGEVGEGGEGGEGEGEGGDDSADDSETAFDGPGDGKGKARVWGFVTASDAWLEANPRHSEARELYRKERRKAARLNRKAERAAKETAQEAASAE